MTDNNVVGYGEGSSGNSGVVSRGYAKVQKDTRTQKDTKTRIGIYKNRNTDDIALSICIVNGSRTLETYSFKSDGSFVSRKYSQGVTGEEGYQSGEDRRLSNLIENSQLVREMIEDLPVELSSHPAIIKILSGDFRDFLRVPST